MLCIRCCQENKNTQYEQCEICRKKIQKYDRTFLQSYCYVKDITLTIEYKYKINRDSIIEGNCKTEGCENTFSKNFRSLVEKGGY